MEKCRYWETSLTFFIRFILWEVVGTKATVTTSTAPRGTGPRRWPCPSTATSCPSCWPSLSSPTSSSSSSSARGTWDLPPISSSCPWRYPICSRSFSRRLGKSRTERGEIICTLIMGSYDEKGADLFAPLWCAFIMPQYRTKRGIGYKDLHFSIIGLQSEKWSSFCPTLCVPHDNYSRHTEQSEAYGINSCIFEEKSAVLFVPLCVFTIIQ